MGEAEEFTFRVERSLAAVEPIGEEEVERLRRWLGRNEKRFRCILEHHFGCGEHTRTIDEREGDRCVVSWLKVYRYMNIIGVQLELRLHPSNLWDVPLSGACRITYGVRFRYRKGWISKRETLRINGEDLEGYVLSRLPGEGTHTAHTIRAEVVRLTDYVVSLLFSPLMRCEGPREMIV